MKIVTLGHIKSSSMKCFLWFFDFQFFPDRPDKKFYTSKMRKISNV